MAQYTDEEIKLANGGKIVDGDYVVFPGSLAIKWISKDVNKVDIKYEKKQNNTTQEYLIAGNVNSTSTSVNIYTWTVPFVANPQLDYPIYRIKVVSSVSNNVLAISNPFKVSVNMELIINNEEE